MSSKSQTFDPQRQSTLSADGFATTFGEALVAERLLLRGTFDRTAAPLSNAWQPSSKSASGFALDCAFALAEMQL